MGQFYNGITGLMGYPVKTEEDILPIVEAEVNEKVADVAAEIGMSATEQKNVTEAVTQIVEENIRKDLYTLQTEVPLGESVQQVMEQLPQTIADAIEEVISPSKQWSNIEQVVLPDVKAETKEQVSDLAATSGMSAAEQKSVIKVAEQIVKEEVKEAIAHVSAQTNQSPRLSATQIKQEIPQMVAAAIAQVLSPNIQTHKRSPIIIADIVKAETKEQVSDLAATNGMSAAEQKSVIKVAEQIVKEEVKEAIAHVSAQTNQSPRLSATQIKQEIPQMVAAAIEQVLSPNIPKRKRSPRTNAYNKELLKQYREEVSQNNQIYKTRGNRVQPLEEYFQELKDDAVANKKRGRVNQRTLNKIKPKKRKTATKGKNGKTAAKKPAAKGKNGKTAAKKPAAKGKNGKNKTQKNK
jgi:hypothetical protein